MTNNVNVDDLTTAALTAKELGYSYAKATALLANVKALPLPGRTKLYRRSDVKAYLLELNAGLLSYLRYLSPEVGYDTVVQTDASASDDQE